MFTVNWFFRGTSIGLLCAFHGTVINSVLNASTLAQVLALVTASAAVAQACDELARSVRRWARYCMIALACLALARKLYCTVHGRCSSLPPALVCASACTYSLSCCLPTCADLSSPCMEEQPHMGLLCFVKVFTTDGLFYR